MDVWFYGSHFEEAALSKKKLSYLFREKFKRLQSKPNYYALIDEQLLMLIAEDDEIAFSQIYDRYWKGLYLTAYSVLQRKDLSKDVVQEVFISLWQRRSVVEIQSLKCWLFQAVRFQVFKAIRATKATDDFYKRVSDISEELIVQDPIIYKELQTAMFDSIHSLPNDQRVIFIMNRERGMTYGQIADSRQISIKTVEKKMSQALKHLRNGLGRVFLF
jgi:RNA polymerase sigma-70 factor (family 1)